MTATTIATPAMPSLFSPNDRRTRRQVLRPAVTSPPADTVGSGRSVTSAPCPALRFAAGGGAGMSLIANPRVENGVANVREQVSRHGHQADEYRDAQLHRVVGRRRRVEERQPDAGEVEH